MLDRSDWRDADCQPEPEPNQNRTRTRTRIRTSHHPSSPLVWDGDYSRDAFPSNPSNPSLPFHPSHPNHHQSHQSVRRLQIPPILIPPICQDQKDERRVAVWLYGCMDCTAVRYAAALCPLCRPLSWPSGALNPFFVLPCPLVVPVSCAVSVHMIPDPLRMEEEGEGLMSCPCVKTNRPGDTWLGALTVRKVA